MGMRLHIRKVSYQTLRELHQNPQNIEYFLFGFSDKVTWFERIAYALKLEKYLLPHIKPYIPTEEEELCLGKAWQVIHFLLTGTASGGKPPASYLLNGEYIGDVDVDGLQPAWSLDTVQVKVWSAYLHSVDTDQFEQKYDLEKMQKLRIYIYEVFMTSEGPTKAFPYLLRDYNILKNFVKAAAQENMALISYIC